MHLLLDSKYYRIYQDIRSRMFHLETVSEYYSFDFCQLLALRYQLSKIDIHSHFDVRRSEWEIVPICNNSRVLFLNILQLLDLKTLIDNTLWIYSVTPSFESQEKHQLSLV